MGFFCYDYLLVTHFLSLKQLSFSQIVYIVMKYRLYTTSYQAWEGMFRAIEKAQRSIYIEMYTFLSDTGETHDFLSLLKDKARLGLEIIIIADVYGSLALSSEKVDELRALGVEFFYFSRWFRRTHRKILIVDEQIAFLGGVNIIEETRHWWDLQIKLEGGVVKPLLKSFAFAYEMAGGKKEKILLYRRLALVQKIKSWITDNLPGTNKSYHLNDYYRKKIIEARHSISIITPYLIPPRRLIALLDAACRRGVRVEIIIPNNTDIKILNKINFLNACRLAELGVHFYLTPNMNHAKIMLIDNEEGVIGSQNMDILSFRWNIEVGVFFRQKNLVRDLGKIISVWRSTAIDFSAAGRKMSFSDKILAFILKIFYRIF